jgi:ATP-dependent protease HslVU (ClpYQ) ATPase subunit
MHCLVIIISDVDQIIRDLVRVAMRQTRDRLKIKVLQ